MFNSLSFFYRLEQFNDVLVQENVSSFDPSSPVFDFTDLDSVTEKGNMSVEVLEVLSCLIFPHFCNTYFLEGLTTIFLYELHLNVKHNEGG